MIKLEISIFVRNGKAYIPTEAKVDLGLYITIDPVYIAELNINDLLDKLRLIQKTGNPIMPRAAAEELMKSQPVLKAAKVSSWKKLAQGGTVYSISWYDTEIILTFSKKDEKGRFIYDSKKKFAANTELETLIPIILADIYTHPELLEEDISNQRKK